MKTKLISLITLLLLSSNSLAGPVFNIMGGGGIAPLHPDGNGVTDRMALSGRFGIVGSGGGFIDGELTLVDGFVLPTIAGHTTTISASDIQKLTYRHVEPVLTSSLYPYLNIIATATDIVSASGTIVFDGSGYLFTPASSTGNLAIQTSLTSSWSVPLYGNVSGDWRVEGSNIFVGNTGLGLITSNQAQGLWKLTGTSSVPEPSSVFIMMSGLLMLAGVRRKPA